VSQATNKTDIKKVTDTLIRTSGGSFSLKNDFFSFFCRLTIKAKCPMMLRSFPMDWQSCPLVVGSCKYKG
jgi:hypothetical protein